MLRCFQKPIFSHGALDVRAAEGHITKVSSGCRRREHKATRRRDLIDVCSTSKNNLTLQDQVIIKLILFLEPW